MRMILLKPELRWDGRTYKAGDEIEAEEIGEVRAWFALGWVKKAELQTRAMTAETAAPIVDNPPQPEQPKSNIDPLTGRRYYRRRDMKADE
jgi:hypothetical protein